MMHDYAQLKRVFEIVQSPHVLRQYFNESNEWCIQRPFGVDYSREQQVYAREE